MFLHKSFLLLLVGAVTIKFIINHGERLMITLNSAALTPFVFHLQVSGADLMAALVFSV